MTRWDEYDIFQFYCNIRLEQLNIVSCQGIGWEGGGGGARPIYFIPKNILIVFGATVPSGPGPPHSRCL